MTFAGGRKESAGSRGQRGEEVHRDRALDVLRELHVLPLSSRLAASLPILPLSVHVGHAVMGPCCLWFACVFNHVYLLFVLLGYRKPVCLSRFGKCIGGVGGIRDGFHSFGA